MSGHTPGPWAINWAGSGKNGNLVYDEVYVYAPASGVEDVAVAADIVDPVTSLPSIENARLIAAAPELLEALLLMIFDEQGEEWRDSKVDQGVWDDRRELGEDKARAAIAKATGAAS